VVLIRSGQHGPEEPDDLGWGALVGGEVQVVDVPGQPVEILETPNVRILAERLTPLLAAAAERSESVGS